MTVPPTTGPQLFKKPYMEMGFVGFTGCMALKRHPVELLELFKSSAGVSGRLFADLAP